MSTLALLPHPLQDSLRAAEIDFWTRSGRAAAVLVRFACSPQFDQAEAVYPIGIDGVLGGAFRRRSRELGLVVHGRYRQWVAGEGQHAPNYGGWTNRAGAPRAGCLLAVRAAVSAGFCVDEQDRGLVASLDGLGELLAAADDSAHFPALCELAPTWDGSAAALVCAVRMSQGPVGRSSVDTGPVGTGLMDAGLVDAGLMATGLMATGLVDAGLVDAAQTGERVRLPSLVGGRR